jgi:hypothetical protein
MRYCLDIMREQIHGKRMWYAGVKREDTVQGARSSSAEKILADKEEGGVDRAPDGAESASKEDFDLKTEAQEVGEEEVKAEGRGLESPEAFAESQKDKAEARGQQGSPKATLSPKGGFGGAWEENCSNLAQLRQLCLIGSPNHWAEYYKSVICMPKPERML